MIVTVKEKSETTSMLYSRHFLSNLEVQIRKLCLESEKLQPLFFERIIC